MLRFLGIANSRKDVLLYYQFKDKGVPSPFWLALFVVNIEENK